MANPATIIATPAARSMRWSVSDCWHCRHHHRVRRPHQPFIRPAGNTEKLRPTPEASGILLSAFFWSYAVLQTPAGWIIDRFGVKWPYAIAFFIWSGVSAATALVGTLNGLIAMRILLGIGESVVTPASMRYIRTNFAEKERGLAIGIYMSGTKYGPAIGAPFAAYMVSALRMAVDVPGYGAGLPAVADSVGSSGAERCRNATVESETAAKKAARGAQFSRLR